MFAFSVYIGAATGPLLTGVIARYGWDKVFWMLIGAVGLAFLVSNQPIFSILYVADPLSQLLTFPILTFTVFHAKCYQFILI